MPASFAAISLDDPRFVDTVSEAKADIFYRPEYCRFRLSGSPHRALMLRYDDPELGGWVFDVTTERDVGQLAFYRAAGDGLCFSRSPRDLASPEYNGPVVWSAGSDDSVRTELLVRYRTAVDGYCRDTGVITEFVRDYSTVAYGIEEPITTVSELVHVDVRAGYAAAERGYRKGHRAAIKRAAREGARVDIVEPTPDTISRLAALYQGTMRRANAEARYGHDEAYFAALFAQLGDRAMLVEARTGEGALAASAVFLRGDRRLWYLYAGTDEAQRGTGANNYKIDRMVQWAADNGYDDLVLGGGFAPGDGLYLTKRGYSHLTAPVRQLRKVHDVAGLLRLEEAKAAHDASLGRATRKDYFPSYWLDA